MVNHGAITGWIVAIAAICGGILYIGNLSGKLASVESDLRNTTQRVDGLYVFIAQQGGNVKKAIQSSDLDPTTKNQLINSLIPTHKLNQQNMNGKK